MLALDVPSGLDCDVGGAAKPTVLADRTATFLAQKPGLAACGGPAGRVDVVSIGVPASFVERVAVDLARRQTLRGTELGELPPRLS